MSITTEIQRLHTNINNMRQNVSDILDAIRNKGVTVPAGSALDDCPDLIASISGGGGGNVPDGYKRVSFVSLHEQSFSVNRPDGLNGQNKNVKYNIQCINADSIASKVTFGSLMIDFYPGQTYFSYPNTGSMPYVNSNSPVNLQAVVNNLDVMTNYGNVSITSHPSPDYNDRYINFIANNGAYLNIFEILQEDQDGNVEFDLIPIIDVNTNDPYFYDIVSGEMWRTQGTPF